MQECGGRLGANRLADLCGHCKVTDGCMSLMILDEHTYALYLHAVLRLGPSLRKAEIAGALKLHYTASPNITVSSISTNTMSLARAGTHLVMNSLAAADTAGLAGNCGGLALTMMSPLSTSSWLLPSPYGLLPYNIWKNITPTAHTSTCHSQAATLSAKSLPVMEVLKLCAVARAAV
jgi:hypothetical protein